MNYIELINNFWRIEDGVQFSGWETKLYFYLVKTANGLGWENNFWHSDAKTSVNIGMSVNTLKTSRNRLKQFGLIDFKEGGSGYGVKTRYQILIPKLQPNPYPNIEPNPQPNLQPLNKKNKTKLNNKKIDKKSFVAPTVEEVIAYVVDNGFEADLGERAWKYYAESNWTDRNGNPVVNWKQKLIAVWFKPQNKKENSHSGGAPAAQRFDENYYKNSKAMAL